jgi:hypothetical protein
VIYEIGQMSAALPADIVPCDGSGNPPSDRAIAEYYTQLADLVIANPDATTIELGSWMGKSARWVAIIKSSDAFLDYLNKRSKFKIATIHDKTKTLVELALDHLTARVETLGQMMKTDELHEIVDRGSKRLGFDKSSHPAALSVSVGVTVAREDLASARDRMQQAFGVQIDAPAPEPLVPTFSPPNKREAEDVEEVA